jgi:channel protein (hemolysin III family)
MTVSKYRLTSYRRSFIACGARHSRHQCKYAGRSLENRQFQCLWSNVCCTIFFSTLYHASRGRTKSILRRIDHCAIYLLIAGTYTPFTFVTLRGTWGWSIFGTIWGLAVIGILQEFLTTTKRRVVSLVIYLLMGWLVIIATRPLVSLLLLAGLALLVTGGLLYTLGVIFHALEKKFFTDTEYFIFLCSPAVFAITSQYYCMYSDFLQYFAPFLQNQKKFSH